jgi:hypothetical protein
VEVCGEFGGAVEIVNNGGAAEAAEEGGRGVAGTVAIGGGIEGDVGVAGEFAAEEGGLSGGAGALEEDRLEQLRGAVEGEGNLARQHVSSFYKNDSAYLFQTPDAELTPIPLPRKEAAP